MGLFPPIVMSYPARRDKNGQPYNLQIQTPGNKNISRAEDSGRSLWFSEPHGVLSDNVDLILIFHQK